MREGAASSTNSTPTRDNETPPTNSCGQPTPVSGTTSTNTETTPTGSEATTTDSEATPTDSVCALEPCNEQLTWKLATENRPLSKKIAPPSPPSPAPTSNKATSTSSSSRSTDKNQRRSRGQSPRVAREVIERREEDTGQLDRPDKWRDLEEGPVSYEK